MNVKSCHIRFCLNYFFLTFKYASREVHFYLYMCILLEKLKEGTICCHNSVNTVMSANHIATVNK